MNNRQFQLVALIILAVSVKLYFDHRRADYTGVYNASGSYETVSAVKHDVTKTFWVELFPFIVYGLGSGQALWDQQDPLNSWAGRTFVLMAAFFTYYEIVQPYIVTRLPTY